MGKYDSIQGLVRDPKYVTPRLPDPSKPVDTQANEEILNTLRRNSEAGDDEYLQGLSPTLAFRKPYLVKGNINPDEAQPTPYRHSARTWYANHPYQWDQLIRIPWGANEDDSKFELLNRDLSNLRGMDSIITKQDYINWLKGRTSLLSSKGIPYDSLYKYPSVATAKSAGRYVADYDRLRNAMADWRETLKGDIFLDGFYDQYNHPGTDYDEWSRREDSRKMRKALDASNGDVEKAWKLIVSGNPDYAITDGAYNALSNMIGYDYRVDSLHDYTGLRGKTIDRFFNSHKAALDNYDVDNSRPSFDPYYSYDKEDYDISMKQQAANDIVLRPNGQNQYARGGHLRTPNTIRSRNGLKMRRADDLGSADYDIYF